jgi:hypothetical protein
MSGPKTFKSSHLRIAVVSNWFDKQIVDAINAVSPEAAQPETLEDILVPLYVARIEAYTTDLERLRGNLPSYPSFQYQFDDEEQELIFDEDLLNSLFEAYAVDGWPVIQHIETLLRNRWRQEDESRSAGVDHSLWQAAVPFFLFARNILALLIREALISIELKAARFIYNRLNSFADIISAAWLTQFKFESVKDASPPVYRMGNRDLAKRLFAGIKNAVDAKARLDDAIRRLPEVQQRLDAIRRGLTTEFQPHSYSSMLAAAPLRDEEERLEEAQRQSELLLVQITQLIADESPLALLVLDALQPQFMQGAMEHKIGQVLFALYEENDKLAKALDPAVSMVQQQFTGRRSQTKYAATDISSLTLPQSGYEMAAARMAVDGLSNNPQYFTLLHEETWSRMIGAGIVARESFEYIVAFQFGQAVNRAIEDSERKSDTFQKAMANVSRIAAGLSLLALASPAAAATPFLRGVGYIANGICLLYAARSVVAEISRLDTKIKDELIDGSSLSVRGLADLGGLVTTNQNVFGEIVLPALTPMLIMMIGANLPLIATLVRRYGYYSDLETLLSDE